MTTNQNFKSKIVSNQYTRFFELKKTLPKSKVSEAETFGRETERVQQKRRVRKTPVKLPPKAVAPKRTPLKWLDNTTDNIHKNQNKGSPYMLVSKDNSDSDGKGGKLKLRDPVCYGVMYEAPPPVDPITIPPFVRAIRISICVEHTRFPLVGKVSKGMGLTHVPEHRLWNVQWCDTTPHFDLLKSMKRFQQINHFPGMSEICRKDLLSRNLNRMLKMYPGDYRIFPKTWLMPTDAYDVSIYANKHKRTFILKPYSSGQGRGIWLTNNLRTIRRQEKLICQAYIERPLLIDGFKFDLRIYTLITSVDPLRIFVYNEGLARFATNKYMPPALGNSHNVYMHLTNYCVNRRNSNYNAGKGNEGGSKRKLSEYNKWLQEHNYNVEEFWAAVDDAIIKTVISAWPVLRHNYHACFPKHDKIQACFQLLGFDILVDWKLKPYILEVNHTPSLLSGEAVDHEVKRPLIRDTLNLICSPLVDKEEIIREDRAVLRDRLMRQAGRRRVVTPTQVSTPKPMGDSQHACSITALAQQIAWEESHMGNYRRIMPPQDSERVNYYCKFYDQIKQVTMFKDTTASLSRLRINAEHVKQKRLQEDLDIEQKRQQKELLERKQKLQANYDPESKASLAELRRKRHEALVAKDLERQQKMLQKTEAKEAMNTWHKLVQKQKPQCKRSLSVIKTQRRQHRRQLQRRTRRARRLEWESRQDAEFFQKHLQGGADTIPPPPPSSVSSSKSKKLKPLPQPLLNKPNPIQASCTTRKKLTNKNKIKNLIKTTTKTQPKRKNNRQLEDWAPEPISLEEKHYQLEWRKQRTDSLNHWQLKELLFNEMFKNGHLTKNDIKLFPYLLYRILRKDTASISANSNQEEEETTLPHSHMEMSVIRKQFGDKHF